MPTLIDEINTLKEGKAAYILGASGYDRELELLYEQGYKHLYAISESFDVYSSPHYTKIKYMFARKENTHFPDSFFDVVYLNDVKDVYIMPQEAKRITRNGGLMISKTADGWKSEVVEKTDGQVPKRINVILATLKTFEGTAHTTDNMVRRLKEYGVECDLYKTIAEAPKDKITLVEWESAHGMIFSQERKVLIELHAFFNKDIDFSWGRLLTSPGYAIWLLKHYAGMDMSLKRLLTDPGYVVWLFKYFLGKVNYPMPSYMQHWEKVLKAHEAGSTIIMRTNELGEYSRIKDYLLMPHCAQPQMHDKVDMHAELCLGTYGFAAPYKGFEYVCEVALKLNLPLLMFLSVNHIHATGIKDTVSYAEHLQKSYGHKGKIHIEIGNLSQEELKRKLAPCTHLLSLQNEVPNISSSMRYMVSLNKPVLSTDIYQAKEAQVIRVKCLKNITREFLESTRGSLTDIDDGTRYLVKILAMVDKHG